MIGNIFICLEEQTYKGLIPEELEGSYARKTYDEDGELLNILPTTFEEVGVDNRIKFGSVIEIDVNGAKHYVMEFNASWLQSEVTALIALGDVLNYPSNTLLTNSEAISLINLYSNDQAEAPTE